MCKEKGTILPWFSIKIFESFLNFQGYARFFFIKNRYNFKIQAKMLIIQNISEVFKNLETNRYQFLIHIT